MTNPFVELNNKMKDTETLLTKREYMATHIMAGMCAQPTILVSDAVHLTDLLIAELNKPRSK